MFNDEIMFGVAQIKRHHFLALYIFLVTNEPTKFSDFNCIKQQMRWC